MKILLSPHPEIIEIDESDLATFSRHRWWIVRHGHLTYVQGRVNGQKTYLHRVLTSAPKGRVVDHIDGNGLNNTRSNLRVVTQRENTLNRRQGGIGFRDGYWHAAMRIGDRRVHLGFFPDEETARKAKAFAAKRVHGDFARELDLDLSGFDPLLLTPTARAVLAQLP